MDTDFHKHYRVRKIICISSFLFRKCHTINLLDFFNADFVRAVTDDVAGHNDVIVTL